MFCSSGRCDSEGTTSESIIHTSGIFIGTVAGGSFLFTVIFGIIFVCIYRRKLRPQARFDGKGKEMVESGYNNFFSCRFCCVNYTSISSANSSKICRCNYLSTQQWWNQYKINTCWDVFSRIHRGCHQEVRNLDRWRRIWVGLPWHSTSWRGSGSKGSVSHIDSGDTGIREWGKHHFYVPDYLLKLLILL